MTTRQILTRIGQAIIVLLVTFTVAFILLTALPSDAVEARYASPDLGLSSDEIQAIKSQYGTDQPIIVQFFTILGGFLTGRFGFSVATGAAVSTMFREALPGTLALAIISFILACVWALLIAVLASTSGPVRGFFNNLPAFLVSIPSFWLGIILIQIVSFKLGWVPVINASSVQSLILPSLTLSVPIAAPLAQVLLRSIDEVETKPFITVVKARGASDSWIFFKNVLRNAMLPTITMAGILFGELIGGAVITEAVFGRTGIGQMTVNAVANRDTPVLMAIVVLAAAVYVLINLLVDLLYPILDPRMRRKARA